MAPQLGQLLLQQVERSKAKQQVVVTFAATLPGDASQISLDWWLHQMNGALLAKDVPVTLEFADVDKPARVLGQGESDPIRVASLKRRIEEMQSYIDDLEAHLNEKAQQLAEEMTGQQIETLSPEETALRAVDNDGFYIDGKGQKWVDIATEARRLNKSYVTIWRAAKGATKNSITSWTVGSTNANGDRILVKQGSWVAKAKKDKQQ